MKLKKSDTTYFGSQTTGFIYIEQYSEDHKDVVRVSLTPDQFRAIADWFLGNEDSIDSAWNQGIENDS